MRWTQSPDEDRMTAARRQKRHLAWRVAAARRQGDAAARLLPPAGPSFPVRGMACAALRRRRLVAGSRGLPVHWAARLSTHRTAMQ